jgi:hypothetical protein
MYQADNAAMQGRGWAVGAWTILVMATVLGLLSGQASQMIGDHFPFGAHALSSDARAAVWPVGAGGARHEALPIILTIPLAVTRTQRMVVARVKHQGEIGAHVGPIRRALSSTQGLLAGLALMGATQPQGR